MSDTTRKEILHFIKRFKGSEDTFLHGCCYWFARILQERFPYTSIVYEPVDGHFFAKYQTAPSDPMFFYDIRGDVTDIYADKTLYCLEDMYDNDYKWYKKLMRDCRDFIDPED